MLPDGIWTFALLCVTSLFAIINPIAVAPVYLSLTQGYEADRQRHTLRVAILTGIAVLVVFALIGRGIFAVFGITIDAFRIAGGLVIFGIGMDMLQAKRSRGKSTPEETREAMHQDDVAITPLGIPMIVGPGSITTVMVLMSGAETLLHIVAVIIAVLIVLGTIYFALRSAPRFVHYLGKSGLNVITRIMGLLLTVIAVQFVIDGVRPILTSIIQAAMT